MTSNAPDQLLGYAVQFPRALLHLLRAGPGDAVSVEVIGDVATHHPEWSASSVWRDGKKLIPEAWYS